MVNTAALIAIVLSAAGAQPRGEVIDFSMPGCVPCQQMAPIVEMLARQGHPIRKVDIYQDPTLADRFGITRCPTFVLVIDGREAHRLSGVVGENELRGMLSRIPPTEVARPAAAAPAAQPAGGNAYAAVNPPGPFRSVLGEPAPLPRPQPREEAAPVKVAQREEGERFWPFSKKKAAPPEVRGSSDELPPSGPGAARGDVSSDLFATNARIRVRIGDKINLGSGTIIESKPGRTLIMTCGHIFRGITEDAKIEVDLAPWDRPRQSVGRLIRHDLDADVGLISIPTDQALTAVPVATRSAAPRVGEQMVCVGCSGGANPTREQIRVTAIDKYEGAATIECEGLPVQGRSGGGLFDTQGRLVGICINADPGAQRGIYAGLAAIHGLLTQTGFAYLYTQGETQVAVAEAPPAAPKTAPAAPPMESAADLGGSNPFASRGSAFEDRGAVAQAAPAEMGRGDIAFSGGTGGRPLDVSADDAEVVVIVRQKGKPESANRVIVIHEASPKFFQYLQGELSPNSTATPGGFSSSSAAPPKAAGLAAGTPARVRRPVESIDAVGTPVATAGDGRASKAGLPQTTLSEQFQPRPFVRSK